MSFKQFTIHVYRKILIKYDSILPFFLNKFDMSSVNREFSVVVKFFIAYSSQHVCLFVCLFVWRPSTACRDPRRLSFVFHYVCSLAEQFTHVVTATSEAIRAIWKNLWSAEALLAVCPPWKWSSCQPAVSSLNVCVEFETPFVLNTPFCFACSESAI